MISPTAIPPVCRIGDYGKLKYELSKREKEARKAQRGGEVKEVKLSVKIATHDFAVRVAKAREVLGKNNKVKVSMFFRGREMQHMDLGRKVMDRLVEAVQDLGKPEAPPKTFGKNLILMIAPK
jgi:translation initiation factor IF-3